MVANRDFDIMYIYSRSKGIRETESPSESRKVRYLNSVLSTRVSTLGKDASRSRYMIDVMQLNSDIEKEMT